MLLRLGSLPQQLAQGILDRFLLQSLGSLGNPAREHSSRQTMLKPRFSLEEFLRGGLARELQGPLLRVSLEEESKRSLKFKLAENGLKPS